ncbi:MAG: M28 family peptidase, partial [Gemmatimonadales bacterium]
MRKAMPVFLLTTTIAAWLMLVPAVGAAQSRTIESAVLFLADDAREGRGVGTAGLDAAAGYIADEFRRIGLAPPANGYYQRFELDPSAPALAHAELGAAAVTNVVGILPGRGLFAEQTMIIGAHYDHLGYGGSGSLDPDSTGVVHNGADDNASGTAALLRTAELLSALEAADRRTVVFIAFTAEELGLLGSDYYTKHPARPLETTVAMINFDMVGRLRQDRLIAIGTGSAAQLPALPSQAAPDAPTAPPAAAPELPPALPPALPTQPEQAAPSPMEQVR